MKRFERDLDSAQVKSSIDAGIAEAKTLGVSGTPAFFVNGHFFSAAKPYEEFAKVIETELSRSKGTAPSL